MGIDVGPIQVTDGLIYSLDAANFRANKWFRWNFG